MVVPDSASYAGGDPQDLAEIYDETHLDDEGEGDFLLDEMDEVFDATRDQNGTQPSRLSPRDNDQTDRNAHLIAEADALLGETTAIENDDADSAPVAASEIELVYGGLMRNHRGAQGSAAHWEAKRLSSDDIADLGYGTDLPSETP
ncbi:hypothetical protein [Brevundimonas sp.]|uniref:hypothetical protein n=1 Tax=Brevundimonas sp. TaxID=1871086 RepID=UPI0028A0526A|nr:hypothetical protein [Brevundimonas sp.]